MRVRRRERHRPLHPLGVDAEIRPEQRPAESVALQLPQRRRLRLAQQQAQLGAQPRARDRRHGAVRDGLGREPAGVLVGGEPEPRRIAGEPQQARRVVAERAVVQHPERAGREIVRGTRVVGQLAVREVQRDRVDREIAPRQVLGQRRAELDVRQRPRALVALASRPGEVEHRVRGGHRGRPEPLVHRHLAAQALRRAARHGHRIALDHEVELVRRYA
jgi:hypothetical protein